MVVGAEQSCSRRQVGATAQAALDRCVSSSRIPCRVDSTRNIQGLAWSDIHEQATLGVGGFCRVNQVCIHKSGCQEKLALKCIKTGAMEQEKVFASAASDLVVEGELLSRLQHPNIIKLHGVCEAKPLDAYTQTKRGYFIVTEILEDTLKNRIEKCRHFQRRGSGLLPFRSRATSSAAVADRVEKIALGIAQGLSYLHKNNVVLRDLKTENIGFDFSGTPKIFDFGLAREIHNVPEKEVAGTLRYLAPEVTLEGGYKLASDVYSFGVVLFELCTLETPFKKYKTAQTFMEGVVYEGYRPSVSTIKSPILRKLVQDCWAEDPSLRPTMAEVVLVLRRYISQSIQHSSSTSTMKKEIGASALLEKSLWSQSFSGAFELENAGDYAENGGTVEQPTKCSISQDISTNKKTTTGEKSILSRLRRSLTSRNRQARLTPVTRAL